MINDATQVGGGGWHFSENMNEFVGKLVILVGGEVSKSQKLCYVIYGWSQILSQIKTVVTIKGVKKMPKMMPTLSKMSWRHLAGISELKIPS